MDVLSPLLEITKPFWDTINMIYFDITLAVILILVAVYATRKKIEQSSKESEDILERA